MAGKVLKKICWHTTWDREAGRKATKGDIIRTGARGVNVPVGMGVYRRALSPVL